MLKPVRGIIGYKDSEGEFWEREDFREAQKYEKQYLLEKSCKHLKVRSRTETQYGSDGGYETRASSWDVVRKYCVKCKKLIEK